MRTNRCSTSSATKASSKWIASCEANEYRLNEFNRRQRIKIQDFETWIVNKEDLILSKLFWAKDSHSELQLRNVNLISTGCDRTYIERWTAKLGLSNLWQETVHD